MVNLALVLSKPGVEVVPVYTVQESNPFLWTVHAAEKLRG